MSLSPSEWAQVLERLEKALELPASQQEAWLDSQEPASAEQAQMLRQLLAERAAVESAAFLGALPGLGAMPVAGFGDLAPGHQVGPYRLISELGQGGMASVWLAERADAAHRRQVALKLPFGGPLAGQLQERFARERQILSTLSHPNIASVLDAGADGPQPWLAMEYIEGKAITDWAQERGLDVRARLRLFVQVLRAVQHAHAQLVIHRDIKPGNVLVDSNGQVKLLDFGVAKLLGEDLAANPALTKLGARALTPQYASPEQISGLPLATSSDVYSLGVLLYQLLTDQLPYEMRRASPVALEEAILAARVERPSSLAADPATRRALRGDVDTIVMKALQRQPAQRYASAEAFAQDIERWLRSQPILARPASRTYRLGRLLWRHRIAFATGTLVMLTLLAATGVSMWQARIAQREARRAEAVQQFLTETLSYNEPDKANGRELSARELLDLSAGRIATRFSDDAATQAALHHAVGGIYSELGEYERAEPHLRRAASIYEVVGQRGSRAHVDALFALCEALNEMSSFAPARDAALRAEAEAQRAFGARNSWSARLLAERAWADYHLGKPAIAIALGEQALAQQRQIGGETSRDYQRIVGILVNFYNGSGKVQQALALQRRAVQLGARTPGYSEGDRLMDRYNLARSRFSTGDIRGLEEDLRELAPQLEKHFGARHDRSIVTVGLWAQTLARVGRFDEAVTLQRGNLERVLARTPVDDELVALGQLQLALVLKFAGRYAAALAPGRLGLASYDTLYSEPTNYRERARTIVGEILVGLGRRSEGEALLRAAAANAARLGDASSAVGADAQLVLAISTRNAALATRACPAIAAGTGSESASSLRCRTIAAWLDALSAAPPERAAAVSKFLVLRDRLLPVLADGQALREELLEMEAAAIEPFDPSRAAQLRDGYRAGFERLFRRPPVPADLHVLH